MSDQEDIPDIPLPSPLEDFLSLVQSDKSLASFLFAQKNKKNEDDSQREVLLTTCQHLFQHVEELSQTLNTLEDSAAGETSLSGLNELYLGNTNEEENLVDAETIWGQVDLQNEALHSVLKKSLKKLSKAADGAEETDTIRILNLESEVLQEEESESENSASNDNDEEEEEEDEEARRMRERMERTLDDMDEDEDDDDSQASDGSEYEDEYEDTRFFGKKKSASKKAKSTQSSTKPTPTSYDDEDLAADPAAKELNNGFFDIHEMEAFADEEEDMLPEQVWDPTPEPSDKKDKANQKSFHQRQREGIDDSDDDDDDEDETYEAMMKLEESSTKRKKYREDDEIEALYGMYKDTTADMEDDEDELEDAVNMTAADLFGAPNKKYIHKWKAQQEKDKKQTLTTKSNNEDDDADSWDEFKFEDKDADWGGEQEEEEDHKTESKAKAKKDDSDADSDDDGSGSSDSDGEGSSSDSDSEEENKKPKANDPKPIPNSKQARQSQKLQQETERLEKEMISEKPWQMVGEAASTARPVNSLLEGTPEFSVASKMAPVITEEHTASLEEIIQRRILNEDWDDVIPRELPDVAWHKKRGELPEVSQEKAKLGLGELYEREYLKKAVGYDKDAAEKESEEDKAKNEMKQLFANINSKLDALSNYHFAPRPVAEEAEVRAATTPAIAMEEVLPLQVSDARVAAPEEVYGKKRGREGILRSETELEQTERKRLRSAKKAARRKSRKEKAADNKLIARVQPGLGLDNPYEKRKAKEQVSMARAEGRITDGQADANSGYGSSNKFFRQMQEEVSKSLRDEPKELEDQKQASRGKKSSSFKM